MYAIVATGGKQYRVEEGQTLEVERLGEAGSDVELQPVMVVDGDQVLATPSELSGASGAHGATALAPVLTWTRRTRRSLASVIV